MGQSAWMRLSPILCCLPDKWKEGANNTTEGGGRKIGENKLLSKKNRYVLCLLTWSQFAGHLHDQFCFRSKMSSSIPHKTISGEHIMLCLYADIHRIILRQYKGKTLSYFMDHLRQLFQCTASSGSAEDFVGNAQRRYSQNSSHSGNERGKS